MSSKDLCTTFLAFLTPDSERKRQTSKYPEQPSDLDLPKATTRLDLIQAVLQLLFKRDGAHGIEEPIHLTSKLILGCVGFS